ncbi:MAG: histidine kinase [Lachnospiraceae bacterium]|nr:histidine kinase [Lachnospiraceae bacterium]
MQIKAEVYEKQLSSHFVLNTLSTIHFLIDHDQPVASEMMQEFLHYTKHVIKMAKSAPWNSAEIEIAFAEHYANLMKMRFEECYNVSYDINVREFKLPLFSCKLLLENAFYHGVRNIGEQGRMSIRTFRREDGRFVLEVSDNGEGFDVEEMWREAEKKGSTLWQIKTAVSEDETAELTVESHKTSRDEILEKWGDQIPPMNTVIRITSQNL